MFIPKEKLLKYSLDKVGINGDFSYGHNDLIKALYKLNNQKIPEDPKLLLPQFDITDYDKEYDGIQLILEAKAMRFEAIPYRLFPMIYRDKILIMDFRRVFPKVVGIVNNIPSKLKVTALQIGSEIFPITIDPKTVLKKHEDYESDVMDLLWFVMSGQAGINIDDILFFVKDKVAFDEIPLQYDPDKGSVYRPDRKSDFYKYISQWYSSDDFVIYNPELKIGNVRQLGNDDVFILEIGTNDKDNKEIDIHKFPSEYDIPDNFLIPAFNSDDEQKAIKKLFENYNVKYRG